MQPADCRLHQQGCGNARVGRRQPATGGNSLGHCNCQQCASTLGPSPRLHSAAGIPPAYIDWPVCEPCHWTTLVGRTTAAVQLHPCGPAPALEPRLYRARRRWGSGRRGSHAAQRPDTSLPFRPVRAALLCGWRHQRLCGLRRRGCPPLPVEQGERGAAGVPAGPLWLHQCGGMEPRQPVLAGVCL